MELDNHTFEKEHIIFQTSIIRFHIARFLDCTPETNVYFHLLQKPASTAEATETRETQEARRDTQEGFEKCFNCICILFQDVLLRMILFMSLEFWCGLQKHRFFHDTEMSFSFQDVSSFVKTEFLNFHM